VPSQRKRPSDKHQDRPGAEHRQELILADGVPRRSGDTPQHQQPGNHGTGIRIDVHRSPRTVERGCGIDINRAELLQLPSSVTDEGLPADPEFAGRLVPQSLDRMKFLTTG
jgi:hypothetical protein